VRYVLASAVCAAIVTLGTGPASAADPNGVDTMPARQILGAVLQAVNSATTVHVVGSATSHGDKITLDLRVLASKVGEGRVTSAGSGFQVVRIGNKLYFKGDHAFLRKYGGSSGAAFLSGKWLYVSSKNKDFAGIASLTDLVPLVDGILNGHGKLAKGTLTRIFGQPAVTLVDTSDGSALYVATTGAPYPIALKHGTGTGGEIIRFEGWGRAVTVVPPKSSIDLAKLSSH
jgi:hypothetical protein